MAIPRQQRSRERASQLRFSILTVSCFFYASVVCSDITVCALTTVLLYGAGVVNEPCANCRGAMERVTACACAVSSNTLTALRRPRW